MSGSDSAAGAVAGASTVGAGAAVIAGSNNDSLLTFLGWAAIILGAIVLTSFIVAFIYKKLRGKK